MIAKAVALATLVAFSHTASTPNAGPTVDVAYTTFLGNASVPGVHFYGGIRYAAPPLSNLRWRAPQPLDESLVKNVQKNVTDARWFGDICLQQPATLGTDDCLTLNIWKPANAKKGDKLAVVIYIHGGGNYYASAQGFPMADWVSVSGGNVVAVNIQYRLGLLGFLASDTVKKDGVVNAGLLDQRAAISWVVRNIANFGGDPKQITLAGESAGGGDIVYHMTAFGGKERSLFQGAIVQSIGTDPIPSPDQYESCFANVTTTAGCTSLVNGDIMACLRAAPLSAIAAAVNGKPSTCKFLPVIDGALIPDYPSRLVARGAFHKVPFIGGHCTDDGSIFVGNPATFVNTTDGFVASIKKRYTTMSNATAARMVELYPADDFSSTYERSKTAFGDTIFTCQDWFIAQKLQSSGMKQAYNYRWNTPDPVALAAAPWQGVRHTADLYFLFNGTNSGPYPAAPVSIFNPFNATERTLATESIGYWTSFTRSFHPDSHRALETSPRWVDSRQGRLILQQSNEKATASKMEERTAAYEARCRFWNEVGAEIGL